MGFIHGLRHGRKCTHSDSKFSGPVGAKNNAGVVELSRSSFFLDYYNNISVGIRTIF